MKKEIFRQKSLDKVKSPESLDDYIQVANPSIWLVLISIVLLLIGACIWGVFGHIDSVIETKVYVEDSVIVCNIPEENASSVEEGMAVRFNDCEATVKDIKKIDKNYVCELQSDQPITDGIYDGSIVIKSVKPMNFIMN